MRANSVVFRKTWIPIFLLLFLIIAGCSSAKTEPDNPAEKTTKSIVLYTTTSVYDSGLLDFLLPVFEEQSGYRVKVIAAGTGEALKNAENGNADIVLVHAPATEKEYQEKGVLKERTSICYNYFIIAGPANDPAGVKEAETAEEAFRRIFESGAVFISRGDGSGTHKKELSIWKSANIDPTESKGYIEAGQGMAETLRIASEKQAYVLTDTGTFYSISGLNLVPLLEESDDLINIYSVSTINPSIIGEERYRNGYELYKFFISPQCLSLIDEFNEKKSQGKYLLFKSLEMGCS